MNIYIYITLISIIIICVIIYYRINAKNDQFVNSSEIIIPTCDINTDIIKLININYSENQPTSGILCIDKKYYTKSNIKLIDEITFNKLLNLLNTQFTIPEIINKRIYSKLFRKQITVQIRNLKSDDDTRTKLIKEFQDIIIQLYKNNIKIRPNNADELIKMMDSQPNYKIKEQVRTILKEYIQISTFPTDYIIDKPYIYLSGGFDYIGQCNLIRYDIENKTFFPIKSPKQKYNFMLTPEILYGGTPFIYKNELYYFSGYEKQYANKLYKYDKKKDELVLVDIKKNIRESNPTNKRFYWFDLNNYFLNPIIVNYNDKLLTFSTSTFDSTMTVNAMNSSREFVTYELNINNVDPSKNYIEMKNLYASQYNIDININGTFLNIPKVKLYINSIIHYDYSTNKNIINNIYDDTNYNLLYMFFGVDRNMNHVYKPEIYLIYKTDIINRLNDWNRNIINEINKAAVYNKDSPLYTEYIATINTKKNENLIYDIPPPIYYRRESCITYYKGEIYIIGGYGYKIGTSPVLDVLYDVEKYNFSTKQWTIVTQLNYDIAGSALVYNDKLYVVSSKSLYMIEYNGNNWTYIPIPGDIIDKTRLSNPQMFVYNNLL